jgi:histone-lysine N-methyltransferase SETD2
MNEADVKTRSVSPPLNLSKVVEWNALRTPSTPLVSDSISDVPNGRGSNTPSYSARLSREDANESNNASSDSEEDTKVVKQETSRPSLKSGSTKAASKASSPSKKRTKAPPQLIPDAPRAEAEALATFETLETNWHQYKTLGKSKVQEDAMACECQYEHGL